MRQITTTSYEHKSYRAMAMMRSSIVGLLYQKTLRLRTAAVAEFSGAPVTLMSADVERIGIGLSSMHDSWASLIEVGLAIWILEMNLGIPILAPVGLLLGT